MRRRSMGAAIALATMLASSQASAQRTTISEHASPAARPRDLRGRFGTDMAKWLMDSPDSATRLRGIERAAAVGSPESVLELTKRAEKASWKNDPREALILARALAPFADRAAVRDALDAFVTATMGTARAALSPEDADPTGRFELARQTAALALVRSGDAKRIAKLVKIVVSGEIGADAAHRALTSTHLPPGYTFDAQVLTSAAGIDLAREIGDPSVASGLRNASHATGSSVRAAAIVALAELGDPSVIAPAKDALADHSPHVRVAGARALAIAGDPDRFKAVAALIDDDSTVDAGVELASTTSDETIVKALARRLATSPSIDQRRAVAISLGRIDSVDALRALAAFVKDPAVASDVAHAIAMSPNAGAMRVIEKMIADAKTQTLGVRAYVARSRATGEKSAAAEDAVDALRSARDGGKRALGVFASLVTGRGDVGAALGDQDARVRRAAALAMQDARFTGDRKILLDRLPKETDEATRELSAILLLDPDTRAHMSTLALVDRARSGAADAPLSAYARAARKGEGVDDAVAQELTSPDAIIRAHAARGLAESGAPDATGLLATAYKNETETDVRRAIVLALASALPRDSVSRVATLQLASSLDPDAATRLYAIRGLSGLPPAGTPEITDVAWLHVETNDGTSAPAGMLGSVLRSDGFALPVVFDDEGYALVPSMPPGGARLVLAPRFAPDKDAPKESPKASP